MEQCLNDIRETKLAADDEGSNTLALDTDSNLQESEAEYHAFVSMDNLKDQVVELSGQLQALTTELRAVRALKELSLASKRCSQHNTTVISCLHCAVEAGNPDLVKQMLAKGVNMETMPSTTITPEFTAVKTGKTEIIRQETPLHHAVRQGNMEITRLLVTHGADVNKKDVIGMTPLHKASMYNHLDIVKYLLERGANINDTDDQGKTALQCASLRNNGEVMEYLVSKGAGFVRQSQI